MTIAVLAHQTRVPVVEAFDILCKLCPRARRIGHGYKIKGAEIPAVRAALLASKRPPRPPMTPDLPGLEEDKVDESSGMTLMDIAELCKAGVSTVRDWIRSGLACAESAQDRAILADASAKLAEAAQTKKPARFTEPEVLAIVRAGGRGHEADLLANASTSKPRPSAAAPRLSAALVREYRLAAKDKLMSATDFQALIGLPALRLPALICPEPPKASPAEGEKGFRGLRLIAEQGPSAPGAGPAGRIR